MAALFTPAIPDYMLVAMVWGLGPTRGLFPEGPTHWYLKWLGDFAMTPPPGGRGPSIVREIMGMPVVSAQVVEEYRALSPKEKEQIQQIKMIVADYIAKNPTPASEAYAQQKAVEHQVRMGGGGYISTSGQGGFKDIQRQVDVADASPGGIPWWGWLLGGIAGLFVVSQLLSVAKLTRGR